MTSAHHVALLGEFEQFVLLAVLQAGSDAYGVTVRRELEQRLNRPVSRGAVYITLDRLERKGYLDSRLTDPTPARGGRAKRCYKATRRGLRALGESRRALLKMWEGLEPAASEL